MIRQIARVFIVIFAVAMLGTGCQTYKGQTTTMASAWTGNNAQQAAANFGKQADKCGAGDAVIWHLEAGAAYRAVGDFQESNRHLDRAAAQIDVFDQEAKVKLAREAAATMSNQQNLPYIGRSYDKIMLHTYKALNLLALGEVDKARPEIIRAYQCQQDAVEDNKARIEKAQDEEQKDKHRDKIEKAKADPKCAEGLESVTKDIEGFKFYADYVNPFTVYLDGLYFLHAGAEGADLERARKSFNRVKEIAGDNKFVQADVQIAEGAGGQPLVPCTYVIFETGGAASRDQIRIDIPIIVTSVSYVGAAFPKLVFHNDHALELTVRGGETEEKTIPLASMDSVIALDFKNEWPVILTKTMISAVAKGVAAYAVNNAVEEKAGFLGGLVSKIATAAYQASVNIADTRGWTTLPKEFQVARIATPVDRKIVLSTASCAPVEVSLVDGVVNVVCVRNINSSSPLLVSQFKLK